VSVSLLFADIVHFDHENLGILGMFTYAEHVVDFIFSLDTAQKQLILSLNQCGDGRV
jgi:hypothetical protein